MSAIANVIPLERIERSILLIRGHKVMLDSDLARLYEVQTRALNQAVKRNADRFPDDFMFQITQEEAAAIFQSRSQFVILKRGENIKYLPHVFTEQGIAAFQRFEQRPCRSSEHWDYARLTPFKNG